MMKCLRLFCLLMLLLENTAMAVKLESLVVRDAGGKVSITCTFNGPFKHKAFTLYNPSRFVLDLEQTTTALNLKNSLRQHDLIQSLRSAYHSGQTLRLVFDARSGVILRKNPSSLRGPQQRILHI